MSLGNVIYHMFERMTSSRNLITMLGEVYETISLREALPKEMSGQ